MGRQRIKQYTVKDIMDILKISKVTALKLIRSGKLKSIRIGRQHWINENDLIVFLLGTEKKGDDDNKQVLVRLNKNPLLGLILKLWAKVRKIP